MESAALTRQDVEHILRVWQRRTQLAHWEIVIDWDRPLDPANDRAMITRDNPYDYATLQLASDWSGWKRRDANLVVAHELIHCVTRDLEEAGEAVAPMLGEPTKILWEARWTHELEAAVDKVATLLVNAAGVV